MFWTYTPLSLSSSTSSSTSTSSTTSTTSTSTFSPTHTAISARPIPVRATSLPQQQQYSCAFPSWPRRNSLSSCTKDEATSYISDEDLCVPEARRRDEDEERMSYHTYGGVVSGSLCEAERRWSGNVKGEKKRPVTGRRRKSRRASNERREMEKIVEESVVG